MENDMNAITAFLQSHFNAVFFTQCVSKMSVKMFSDLNGLLTGDESHQLIIPGLLSDGSF